tara:strand:+ start:1781 stop:2068 length:288 start_codon:yes stop_codon:yes gene_type:complete
MGRYSLLTDGSDLEGIVPRYPNIPLSFDDRYFITTEGDRLDILAEQFYNDSTLWWVISIANPSINKGSYFITPGTQIRVPSNISLIIQNYKNLNS